MTENDLIGPTEAPDLHVMTFNIRRRMPRMSPRTVDLWSVRVPAVTALLRAERPHLLGTQEVLPDQDRAVSAALGADYRRIGHGRDADGQGEGCPLYYDATRLDLTSWVQLALSDTPGIPGSRSWGNITPRLLVRAEFRDRATGVHFLMINTHLDQMSRRSRVRAAEFIRTMVAAQDLPAVITGDLNSGEDTAPITALLAGRHPGDDRALVDAWHAADRRLTPKWGTFPNYRAPRHRRKRIDWIVVTPDVDVTSLGINTRRPGGVWPSDHLPVQAVIRMPEPS